jgi:gas vesicle protein
MTTKKEPEVFLGGVLIGSAIGTLVGLMLAPRTGKETRKMIKKTADALPEMAEDLSNSVIYHSQRLSYSTQNNFNQTMKRLKVAIATGIKASKESMNKD